MTVKLLSPWGDFPINALFTTDAATETAMVEQKVATTDLVGGIPWPPAQPAQLRPLYSVEEGGQLRGFADSVGDRLVISADAPDDSDGRPDTVYLQVAP